MNLTNLIKKVLPGRMRATLRGYMLRLLQEDFQEKWVKLPEEELQLLRQINLLASMLDSMLDRELWFIDIVSVGDDEVEIVGWALPPREGYLPITFMVNDVEFDHVEYPMLRKDIQSLLWYRPQAAYCAFACRKRIAEDQLFADDHAVFKYVDRRTMRPLREEQNKYYFNPRKETVPLPDATRIRRVHGAEGSFLIQGYTHFVNLRNALKRVCKKDFTDFPEILDWGCGCGRLIRYLAGLDGVSVTGVDIDADNVNWCRQNIGIGRFLDIPLHPPTGLEEGSFDLLLGISVFTHLYEQDQFRWLGELRRLASDGAVLLMTIMSNAGVAFVKPSLPQLCLFKQAGFLDLGVNKDLYEMIQDKSYYRNTFHTHEYILDRWSDFFEILEIIPAYIGTYQDLVIMKKSR